MSDRAADAARRADEVIGYRTWMILEPVDDAADGLLIWALATIEYPQLPSGYGWTGRHLPGGRRLYPFDFAQVNSDSSAFDLMADDKGMLQECRSWPTFYRPEASSAPPAFLPRLRHRSIGTFRKAQKNTGGSMSRELRPAERLVCRMVLGSLFVVICGFLVLNAIESRFGRSPPVRKVIVRAEPVNSVVRVSEHPKTSVGSDDSGPSPQEKSSRGAEPDDSERVSPSIRKAGLERLGAMALERMVRFDSQPFEQPADAQSIAFTEVEPRPILTETFQASPKETIAIASATPASLLNPPQQLSISEQEDTPARGKVEQASATAEPLTEEQVLHIKSRLRDLGFLSSAKRGAWDASARNALRDFKVANSLSNNDVWDIETSNRINSQAAVHADDSIIGNWSAAPCRSVKPTDVRLSVSSRRAKSSAGSVCEFRDLKATAREWRVKATCSQGDKHWTANGKFSLSANKLVWTSERDVISYFRCTSVAAH